MAAIDPGEQRTVIMAAPLPPAPPARREAAAPTGDRIEALDFVRGVALFGILLMNIVDFGLPDAYTNPQNSGGATGANLLAWIVTQIGFEGTQRALFSMLFGASAILFTARLEAAGRPDAADLYVRRNLWLVGFGMINAFLLIWYGDILYAYGVIALFIFPFRKMAARTLMTIGVAALLLGAAWNFWEAREALHQSAAYEAAVAARDRGEESYDSSRDLRLGKRRGPNMCRARRASPARPRRCAAATSPPSGTCCPTTCYWQTWGLYRYFFDVFGMMLIGMALFRLGVLTLHRRTGVYVAMMLGGYAIGLDRQLPRNAAGSSATSSARSPSPRRTSPTISAGWR